MKKFIYFFLFFLVSLAANSQVQRPAGNPSPNSPTGYSLYGWSRADSGYIWKQRDTFPAKFPTIIWHTNGNFYKSSGNGGAWSIFASSTAGTVSSVSGNAPISVANGTTTPTISADTSYNGLATKKWLYKTVDSLGFIKLNISDTAAMLLSRLKVSDTSYMLSGYLRKADTSAMLSNYVPTFRTIGTNAPLFGGGNLSANRTLGADTGRNSAQLVTGGSLTAVKDSLVALIASSGGGTVLSVATTDGYGVISSVANSTSTPNISLRVDTVSISTRDWRQKGIDSVQANLVAGLALKLNISDTAAMLSNRFKISDTLSMLLPYLRKSDTLNMLSPYRRTTTKIQNSDLANSTISGISLGSNLADLTFGQYLQVGASSYNGSAATTITTNGTSTNAGSTLVARDVNGDFSARNISATQFLGTASSASTVAITNDITTNATYYPMFSTVTTGSTSTRVSSSKLTYNPSTGMLSSTGFTGALTGNASTATILQTARTINGVAFDGSADITISAAVGNSLTAGYGITGSPFDGALARTWVIDTSNISTKANVTGALVAKLNIYDTAAMLSGYKTYYPRTAISAGTGISYNAATGVITNSSPSSGGTVTSVATNTGSGITGGTITSTGTIAADTTILSTKANVTGTLVGYTTVSRFTDSLTNVQSRIQTKQPLGAYITLADSTTILSGRWLPNRSADSIAVIRALANSKGTGSVTSVATGVGLSGGTITTSGTISADTTTLSTRAYVTGQLVGYATTGNLALKLNISDTAAMLSNYRRTSTLIQQSEVSGLSTSLAAKLNISDTASMLSGYKTYYPRTAISAGTGITYDASTGVITNSSPSSGGTVTSVATNNGSGITGGTITSTGTIAADTSILSTKANVTGTLVGYTTLAQNALKLNISDTATMLSNYARLSGAIFTGSIGGTRSTFNNSTQSQIEIWGWNNTQGASFNAGELRLGGVSSIQGRLWYSSAGNTTLYLDNTFDDANAEISFRTRISGTPINALVLTSNTAVFNGSMTADSIIKTGGTSSQILLADGSTIPTSSYGTGSVTSVSAGTGMSFTTITSTGAVNADTTTLATRAYAAGLDVAKANTSLNNVNGVLSSTYGGAGSVSGILKANGTGTVSAAAAADIPSLSAYYLPLSGGTLTGALSGTSLSMSGAGRMERVQVGTSGTLNDLTGVGQTLQFGNYTAGSFISGIADNFIYKTSSALGGLSAQSLILQTRSDVSGGGVAFVYGSTPAVGLYMNGNGNTLIKTTTDNGTDALQVAGSGLFSSSVTMPYLSISTGSNTLANINSSNATGGYITWQTNGTTIADIGTATQVFGSGGSEVFAINGRGARAIALGTNGVNRLNIASTGEVSLSSSISSTRGVFNNSTQSQLEIFGWNNIQGASTNAGEIRFGGTSSVQGRLIYSSAGNSTLYLDNTFDNANAEIKLRTRVAGTAVDALTLTSTAATFASSATATSFIRSGGTSSQFLKADGSVDGSTYLTSAGAVTSLTGTTNQITVSASTGAVTVSLPSAVTISGAMTASSFFESSDLRKKDIVSVTEQADGIDFIGFKWKKELNLDNRKHLGVIAQQVEKVIPDAVTTDEKGFKSVNYTEVLIFKLQSLTEKVSELEKELKKLKTNSKKLNLEN